MVLLFCFLFLSQWFVLLNKILVRSFLAVIICPAVNRRKITRPVTMNTLDRRCPFQRSRSPWILGSLFPAIPDAVEEIEYKQQLGCENNHCSDRDKLVEPLEVTKSIKCI